MSGNREVIAPARCGGRSPTGNEAISPGKSGLRELPRDWVKASLEDISAINPGFGNDDHPDDIEVTFLPMKCVEELTGRIDLSMVKELSEVRKGYTPFKNGDILFAKITPCMENGKVAIAHDLKNGLGFGSTEFHVIRLPNSFPKQFFFCYLVQEGFRKEAQRNMTGSAGQLRVPSSYMREAPVPLPPLPEQHRIVDKIEELFTKLDAGVEALKKIKVQLKQYRQAVLKCAFEGKLTAEWREKHKDQLEPASVLLERIEEERKKKLGQPAPQLRQSGKKHKEPAPLDISELHRLPESWTWAALGEIAEFKNGINFSRNQKGNKGTLTIDVLNMYSKSIFLSLENLYRVNKLVSDECVLRYGDVLFVRSSVKREGVGWASAFKEISEPVTFCGFIIRARLLGQGVLPEYITYFMRTDFARQLIVRKGSQVTITNISQDSVGRILVPLTPVAEQRKIVEEIERRFSVADEIEKVVDKSLKQADRMRQSILKMAFEGKLVPQDPADEPAEKLLERIKAEKAKREAEPKTKKKNTKSNAK